MSEREVRIAESILRPKIEAIVYHCVNEAEKAAASGNDISYHELDKMIKDRIDLHFRLYI